MIKTFHFLTGLPLAGSSLLADVLNQNPLVHASSISAMDSTYGTLTALWSSPSPEGVQSLLHHDALTAKARIVRYLGAGMTAWYQDVERPVIVDKGRHWINHLDQLKATHPNGRVVCMVRNPLDCFAAVQRQHLQFPLLSDGPPGEPLFARTLRHFHPDGPIGSALVRIEDKLGLAKRWPSLVFLVYEEFAQHPKRALQKLYADLDMDWYEHDFDNVVPVSLSLDAMTNGKCRPCREAGPIRPPRSGWREHVPEQLAQRFTKDYPMTFSKWKEWWF